MSSPSGRPRVCMLILNEVVRDGRVIREARVVAEFADLTVVGLDRGHFATDEQAISRELGFEVRLARLGGYARLPRNIVGYGLRYVKAVSAMTRLAKACRPEILHVHEVDALPIGLRVARATGAKLIYDAHELYRETSYMGSNPLMRRHWCRVERRGMQAAAAIIACNRFRAEIMHREYGAPQMPAVVRNVQPFQACQPNDSLRQRMAQQDPQVRSLVLYQGGIGAERGSDVLVRALAHLPAHVGLVLIGPGKAEFLDSLRAIADASGVASRLLLHPPVDQAELFRLTCSADVGVVVYQNTNRNNYFCAPNKLYEYAAAGLPMVAADLPPIREFLESYDCGAMIDPTDPASVAQAVLSLLGDPARLEQCRRNALAAVQVECWENEQQRLREVYEAVAGRPLPAAPVAVC